MTKERIKTKYCVRKRMTKGIINRGNTRRQGRNHQVRTKKYVTEKKQITKIMRKQRKLFKRRKNQKISKE